MTVGQRISERLDAIGMSQAELARRVGMAQSSINSLINRNKVGSKHLHRIARELETTPAYLSCETDDPQSSAPDHHLSLDEIGWLEKLRQLPEADRAAVLRLTKSLARGDEP